MSVWPSRISFTPSPCRMISVSGNAAPPWETKYTGPDSGSGSSGVCAVAVAISDSFGQPAGLELNCASGHAFWSVVSLEGRTLGIVSSTLWMFAPPPAGKPILTWKLAPFARLVFPSVEAENTGLNGNAPQPCAWNGDETAVVAPWAPEIAPAIDIGLQLVGFRMNQGR